MKNKNYHGFVYTLPKKDKRRKKYLRQLKKRGFDDTETWNLFMVLAKYTLPRLKRFREIAVSYPYKLTPKKWDKILGKMIVAFELIITDEPTAKDAKKIKKGLKLYHKYFMDLWW